ncbi:aminodeoxychorismate/anthranilate synthase component II [Paraglaciecola aquimarina]|uniref:anthranilate synthase n=1 Tax=Paraglaciecola algarum TaxID=3050085 RepID=A0ABS9DAG3_9ALTE|nr:aminodeoxychorismate/anthranilate synthase component II [Paraglaciecola sp. G1-23]MCF2949951.1 aminodeoxychorismate/anthranilate synthase component II [Paraglaciecola sp. G1-23]
MSSQNNSNICVFLLDNFDSFTYNLVDELRSLGLELIIYRNSVPAELILEKMQEQAKKPHKQVMLMLSPGPGNPSQAGSMLPLLALVKGRFPVLGICLGHQAIVESYGGNIVRSNEVMHGKSSLIEHSADKMFANMPQPLPVARYHSLMAANIPAELSLLAKFEDIPMAVAHLKDMMLGFQFHPESILTSQGSQLLMQSIEYLTRTQPLNQPQN